ncbi:MAG: nucleotidyltransferase family protein [Shimia sp.]
MNPLVVLPAAGASSRMGGRDKLLEDVDGQPLLARQTAQALATGWDVLVVLPPSLSPEHERRSAARAKVVPPAARVTNVSRAGGEVEGLGRTIAHAARLAPDTATSLLVMLPDLVELDTDDLRAVADGGGLARGTDASGRPGHPVSIPRRHFAALAALGPDDAAPGRLMARLGPRLVPLPDQHATRDLDTPEAWAAWRAERRGA